MASPASSAPQSSELQLVFYRAVRDLKPVWMLEDMRTMETFYREEDSNQRTYSPSEALLYAIVHDHQAYARYLLRHFTDKALAKPGERFCCCPSSAPHLSMAVRYDRRLILGLILQVRSDKNDHSCTVSTKGNFFFFFFFFPSWGEKYRRFYKNSKIL